MANRRKLLNKIKPAVSKKVLLLLAGMVWFGVGILLLDYARTWLLMSPFPGLLCILFAGLVLAAMINQFGFSRLAKKNIDRIQAYYSNRICLFAFQKWTNYPLVAVMISLGIYLRVYSHLPRSLLSILYCGIGGGLFLASLQYFKQIYLLHRN